MNVALIFGGRSPEHEVSIITAHQVRAALAENFDVIPIYITKDGNWLTGEKLTDLKTFTEGTLPVAVDYDIVSVEFAATPRFFVTPNRIGLFRKKRELHIDVAFPAVHGVNGEDGTLQGLFELMNIPYVGAGVVSSGIGMDKIMMKAVLNENDFPIVPYIYFSKHNWNSSSDNYVRIIADEIGYPAFVKPSISGSSIGVSKVTNEEEARDAAELACRYSSRILVEQAITNGYEINCSVLGTNTPAVSVCEQPITNTDFLSFDDKYIHDNTDTESTKDDTTDAGIASGMAGAQRKIPAPIPDEMALHIQELAAGAFIVLDCKGIARVDFLVSEDDKVYVNEINTIPGSFSFYLWEYDDTSFPNLVYQLVNLALETHHEKSRLAYSHSTNLLSQAGASLNKLGSDTQQEETT